MALRHCSLIVALAFSALVAIAPGPGQAADSTPVAAATKQVGLGAQQIGQGEVLSGTGELAKGVGKTVVEGVKYTGVTVWEYTVEGATIVGSSTRDFFVDLFGG
jgi:hypothetical protein